MEIGLIYSKDDPRQAEAKKFLRRYIKDRGILAKIFEHDQPVKSPTVIINGQVLKDERKEPREENPRMYPGIKDIAQALEEHLWSF